MAPRVLTLSRPGFDLRSTAFVVAGLAAYIATVYAAVVIAGGWLVGRAGTANLWLSILATAAVAISFEPVQSRLERRAADLFDLRASPYEVLSRFATTPTAADATEELPVRMARLLAEGTGAAAAQVWLTPGSQGGRPILAATWPDGTGIPNHVGDPDAAGFPGDDAPWRSLAVRDGGETLGLLSVREHDQRPLTPVEERLFANLAAQAGLVLRSTRLRAELSARLVELSARVAELRASRERLIETQDDERRRLERDIHDGAQQNLVALAVNLRLAETLLARAPQRAAEVLAAQSRAACEAIDNLTQLSRGIYPAMLAVEGLVPALGAVAAASPLPVELAAGDLRLPTRVEAALYFCCLEALQNAAKHSGAGAVRVEIESSRGSVHMAVSDTGHGFASSEAAEGAGTANMRDRVDAVGGTFSITSTPGLGTCVTVDIPVPALAAATP